MNSTTKPPDLVPTSTCVPLRARAAKLSVLHLGKYYPPHMGGIETHLQNLCVGLRHSVELQVFVASENHTSADQKLDGISISRVPTRLTLAGTPLCPGMINKIRKSNVDILHIHLPNPNAVLAYLASGFRGPVVYTYHSDTVRQKFLGAAFEPFLHAALRRSAAIIATSPDYRRTSRVLARYLDRCHVIPYGISLDQFENCERSRVNKVRSQHGERLILSVGRLVYYKGFEYLIRAMTQVRGRLLIIGDGPLRPSLERLTSELSLGDKVVFVGEVQNEEIVPYYHAADLFVLGSVARSEAFGIVQIEAMASGTPVVNTALDSGVPFVSLDGQTGITVPPADANSLAGAINLLLDNSELRQALGNRARKRARDEFGVETMTSRTLALYERISNRDQGTLTS
ncbi:MAG: glycosyl transferase family 1 [Terriglobia bacterium]|nr:MAG: glycosyl transferase family 1 [Terriglobia bacterium]